MIFSIKNTMLSILLVLSMLFTAACTPIKMENTNNNELTVKVLNIGQGDAILIKQKDKVTLIDTGDVEQQDNLIKLLKSEKIVVIDNLIITHPHADHLGGALGVLNNFTVNNVYDNGQSTTTKLYRNYLKKVTEKKIKYNQLVAGQQLELGNDAFLKIISPASSFDKNGELNNNSIVTQLVYHSFKMLLTGDAEEETESNIVKSNIDIKSDVLKSPHHGSRSSSSKNFLKAVDAKDVIISLGKDNDYKHPHEEVLKRYKSLNMNIYRTDLNGTVTINTNGKTYENLKEQ